MRQMTRALRNPEPSDHDEIVELLCARERADGVEPGYWQQLVLAESGAPEFDPSVNAIVARGASGDLVGFAALVGDGGFAAVDPEREGERLGTRLLGWLEQRGRELAHERHRQLVGARNLRARDLLEGAGYGHTRSYLQMGKDLDRGLTAPRLPRGITLSAPDPGRDAAELHQLVDAAFSANADSRPHTLERFVAEHLAAARLDRDLSVVARRRGSVVGMALCQRAAEKVVLLDVLAVAREERGRGLGRALLLGVFATARELGMRRVVLFVASDNPVARRLYEGTGMVERHRGDVFEKPVLQDPHL